MSNKKYLIRLGAVSAMIAPIITAVACGTTPLSDEDSRIIRTYTSAEAINLYEKLWLQKVTDIKFPTGGTGVNAPYNHKDLIGDTRIADIVKFFITNQLIGNPAYLNDLGVKLLKINDASGNPKYSTEQLTEIGILSKYDLGYDAKLDTIPDNTIVTAAEFTGLTRVQIITKILGSENSIGFINEIYKFILVQEYLKLTKAEFEEYNEDYEFTSTQKEISENDPFLLTNTLLDKKFFFNWKMDLTDSDTKRFIGDEDIEEVEYAVAPGAAVDNTLIEGVKEFLYQDGRDETVGDFETYSNKRKTLADGLWDLSAGFNFDDLTVNDMGTPNDTSDDTTSKDPKKVGINFNELIGYQGISTQASGNGKLNFSLSGLKKAKQGDYWFGFKQNNNLITEDIKKQANIGDNVSMNLALGLMPIYDTTASKITIKGTFFRGAGETAAQIEQENKLTWFLYQNDNTLYADALKYFTADTKDGGQEIKLVISNKLIRDALIDKGLTFISDKST